MIGAETGVGGLYETGVSTTGLAEWEVIKICVFSVEVAGEVMEWCRVGRSLIWGSWDAMLTTGIRNAAAIFADISPHRVDRFYRLLCRCEGRRILIVCTMGNSDQRRRLDCEAGGTPIST